MVLQIIRRKGKEKQKNKYQGFVNMEEMKDKEPTKEETNLLLFVLNSIRLHYNTTTTPSVDQVSTAMVQ